MGWGDTPSPDGAACTQITLPHTPWPGPQAQAKKVVLKKWYYRKKNVVLKKWHYRKCHLNYPVHTGPPPAGGQGVHRDPPKPGLRGGQGLGQATGAQAKKVVLKKWYYRKCHLNYPVHTGPPPLTAPRC